jgi:hypothetical protein
MNGRFAPFTADGGVDAVAAEEVRAGWRDEVAAGGTASLLQLNQPTR